MAADKIRVGIIGANAHYGWSMRAHLPALRALPDFELTAVCTSRPETATESAAHYGARLAFHDYHAMVTHPDIDLVAVSVRVPLHHDMVMAALHAGKHVYCEWPLGANLAEAEAMATVARQECAHHDRLTGQWRPGLAASAGTAGGGLRGRGALLHHGHVPAWPPAQGAGPRLDG